MKNALWHGGKIHEAQHTSEEQHDAQLQPVIAQPSSQM